jgi:hypothetical protein
MWWWSSLYLDEEPLFGPFDPAATLNHKVTVSSLVVHGELD